MGNKVTVRMFRSTARRGSGRFAFSSLGGLGFRIQGFRVQGTVGK